LSRASAGRCRFCGCAGDSCRLPDGDRCNWLALDRNVCTSPPCLRAHFAVVARVKARASRKRTPGDIHQLMQQEKRDRRRAARARKKGKAA
jgi:hypothetical protein